MTMEQDDPKIIRERLDSFYLQSSRGLMILNAGAVIAVLGLFQALYGKGDAGAFKAFAVASGLFYLLGTGSAIWMLWIKYELLDCEATSRVSQQLARLGQRGKGAFLFSAAMFGVGTIVVLIGIACAVG